ncbi:MAG: hypothetical protein IKT52_08525 [Oscillospiraceae bacterium]|nr:hypothetical protein [Oscillospiraceae bacterium]
MKDRVPGSPGRYSAVVTTENLQALQTGQPFTITLVRDDDPIEPGTPYSKAAVLPDSAAEAICPDVENPTPADAFIALHTKKAPAGYGLGTVNPPAISDLNTCKQSGWYYTSEQTLNVPEKYRYIFDYSSVLVYARTSKQIVQRLISAGYWTHSEMLRYTLDGGETWTEEFVTPPLAVGVEYRTTERSDGKPVYVKRISVTESDISALGSGVNRYINHSISGFGRLVRCHAVMDNAYPLPHISYRGSGNPSIISINNVNMTTIAITAINIEQTAPSFTFDIYYCKQ